VIKSSKRKIEFLKKEYFNITVSQLTGNILELGYDQGDNFKYYNSSCNVIAIDWIFRSYCATYSGHIVPHKTDVISRPNLHINL